MVYELDGKCIELTISHVDCTAIEKRFTIPRERARILSAK